MVPTGRRLQRRLPRDPWLTNLLPATHPHIADRCRVCCNVPAHGNHEADMFPDPDPTRARRRGMAALDPRRDRDRDPSRDGPHCQQLSSFPDSLGVMFCCSSFIACGAPPHAICDCSLIGRRRFVSIPRPPASRWADEPETDAMLLVWANVMITVLFLSLRGLPATPSYSHYD